MKKKIQKKKAVVKPTEKKEVVKKAKLNMRCVSCGKLYVENGYLECNECLEKNALKRNAFDKAIELGKKLLIENKPKISKKLNAEITKLEKNPVFIEMVNSMDQKEIPKGVYPRLRVIINNGCDVIFGNAVTGHLFVLENHFGNYSLKLLRVPQ